MVPTVPVSAVSSSILQPSADCKRGRRKGATLKNVKNRQKVSKSFSILFDNFRAGQKTSKIVKKLQNCFRHFSTIFAQGKKRRKSTKNFKTVFDTFRQFSRGTILPAPFGGFWNHPVHVVCCMLDCPLLLVKKQRKVNQLPETDGALVPQENGWLNRRRDSPWKP